MLSKENHYVMRSGWLRAGILGANDGILSTASLVIGVAAASLSKEPILLTGIAGLVAGAFSMAAGEYVSVSSQSDLEQADLKREQKELEEMPEQELVELAKIYEHRGLTPALAHQVALQLTQHNALEAHARDELGIMELTAANPLQAAWASGIAFIAGGALPVVGALFIPLKYMVLGQYVLALFVLLALGIAAAKTGGSSIKKAVLRIVFWGTMAMGATALVGYFFGVNV